MKIQLIWNVSYTKIGWYLPKIEQIVHDMSNLPTIMDTKKKTFWAFLFLQIKPYWSEDILEIVRNNIKVLIKVKNSIKTINF